MGIRLIDIKDRLPPVTHRIKFKDDSGTTVEADTPIRRLTPGVRRQIYALIPDPPAPVESIDQHGNPLKTKFVNREDPTYLRDLDAAITKRNCAIAAVALNVDVSDPSTNKPFGWDDLGPGDRGDRRELYLRLAVEQVEKSLLDGEVVTIIEMATSTQGDSETSVVQQLGEPSAPTSGPSGGTSDRKKDGGSPTSSA